MSAPCRSKSSCQTLPAREVVARSFQVFATEVSGRSLPTAARGACLHIATFWILTTWSTEGPMNRAFHRILFAVMPALGLLLTASSACQAWDDRSCCSNCGSQDCRVCRWCDAICRFQLADGSTHCAWRRTWYGPNALATPLRPYYIPRPPECSNCDGYAAGYVLGNFPAPDRNVVVSPDVAPEAGEGFSPAQYERLGKIRNELDIAGPLGGPATSRGGPPGR